MSFNKEHLVWIKRYAKNELHTQKEGLEDLREGYEKKEYQKQYEQNIKELEEIIDICNNPTKLEHALK